MNRLIIIGNGFDLAHGLPTGYCDFINRYWKNVINELKDKKIYDDHFIHIDISRTMFDEWAKHDFEMTVWDQTSLFVFFKKYYDLAGKRFKNDFFEKICNSNLDLNWVDIENIYYDILISIINEEKSIIKTGFKNNKEKEKSILKLHREFAEVKMLLKKYLKKRVEEIYDFAHLNHSLMKIFESKIYKDKELDNFLKEISNKGEAMLKESQQVFLKKRTGFAGADKLQGINMLTTFLSFNYTSTMISYTNFLKFKSDSLNEIHGNILDESNPINFGFGDEMDGHYKQIENMNDNEYLRNIKSFQYLHTPNYKKLLDLIDSEVFQVYIMGHSCGLSDRTLLNTIFEHENCCSIKIFYHQKEDGSDNYTEITQNISRHFNKKALMRERIVNKTLCQPLPQIKLPEKKTNPQL